VEPKDQGGGKEVNRQSLKIKIKNDKVSKVYRVVSDGDNDGDGNDAEGLGSVGLGDEKADDEGRPGDRTYIQICTFQILFHRLLIVCFSSRNGESEKRRR
jgi:hypothetical protein